MKKFRHKKYWAALCFLILATIVYTLFFPLPLQHRYEYRSVVWLECRYHFVLTDGNDSLFCTGMAPDSTLSLLSAESQEAMAVNTAQGFWYCPFNLFHLSENRILAPALAVCPDTMLPFLQSHVALLLHQSEKKLTILSAQQSSMANHLKSYLKSHDVYDEGYNQLARYKNQHAANLSELNQTLRIVRRLLKSANPQITFLATYTYRFVKHNGTFSTKSYACIRKKLRDDARMAEITPVNQLDHVGTLSLGYPLINLMSFTSPGRTKQVLLFALNVSTPPESFSNAKVARIDGRAWLNKNNSSYSSSLPILNCVIGAPVVDHRGVLIGMAGPQGIIPIK
jgi:hypothetical protein